MEQIAEMEFIVFALFDKDNKRVYRQGAYFRIQIWKCIQVLATV